MIWVASILEAARRVPWQAWAVAGVLLFAATYHWRAVNAAYQAGHAKAVETIKSANETAKGKADDAIKDVDSCFAAGGSWDRGRGVCIRASR